MTEPAHQELAATTKVVRRESTSRAWRLARKELREILRDRRTVITLILMPLLVYPLLGALMSKGVLSGLAGAQQMRVEVCLESEIDPSVLSRQLVQGERFLLAGMENPPPTDQEAERGTLIFPSEPNLIFVFNQPGDSLLLEQLIGQAQADVGIRLTPDPVVEKDAAEPARPEFLRWQFIRRENSRLAERAIRVLQDRLRALNDGYLDQLVAAGRIPPVRPAQISEQLVASEAETASPLVTFIPLVLVLMTMTGAVYPAIDLTAGERERGTMEILVAAPVSRMNLLAGKFVAVLTVALLTASMNLLSMFATLFALGLEGTVLGSVTFTMVFQVAVLMVVFASFFSSVLLSITSVARSFKEAQAYLIPLMLVSLSPGIFALLPDVRMNGVLAVTPLINTVLMGRDLLQGNVQLLTFAIVLISTALYGALTLSLAARIFGSDAVLYGSSGTWADLFRRPTDYRDAASVPVAATCLAALFSLFIVLNGLPARLSDQLRTQLLLNAFVLVLMFVGLPLLAAGVARIRIRSGFALQRSAVRFFLSAVLLGASLWPFLYELQVLLMSETRIAVLESAFETLRAGLAAMPLWLKLLCLAVAPAVCEEIFFRGFLQNAIRRTTSALVAVVSTAVLFGLFHVVVKDVLFFERLLPSTLMGIVLGMIYERSCSVLPGMLLHVLHNGLLISVAHYERRLTDYGIGVSEQQHLPAGLLLVAACLAVAGLSIMSLGRQRGRLPDAIA